MTSTCKFCERCQQRVVHRPGTMTILGCMDLCSPCYWHYCSLIERLAAFFGIQVRSQVPTNLEQEEGKLNE